MPDARHPIVRRLRSAPPRTQVSMFEGTCYMTPLIGAYLADSRWGRYKTILIFSSIYLLVRTLGGGGLAGRQGGTWNRGG